MPDNHAEKHLWVGPNKNSKNYKKDNQKLLDLFMNRKGSEFDKQESIKKEILSLLLEKTNFIEESDPGHWDDIFRDKKNYFDNSSQLRFFTNIREGICWNGEWVEPDDEDRWRSSYLWGFHKDGIELVNGYEYEGHKGFTDDELKLIGNTIKKYLKEKYDISTIVKVLKRPNMN